MEEGPERRRLDGPVQGGEEQVGAGWLQAPRRINTCSHAAPCPCLSAEDGGWVALDEQRSLRFPARHHRLHLPLAGTAAAAVAPSRRFRLRVVSVADPAAANSVQLCCLDLYCRPQQAQQAQHEQQTARQEAQAQGFVPPPPQQAPPAGPQLSAARASGAAQAPQPEPANPWAALFLGGS